MQTFDISNRDLAGHLSKIIPNTLLTFRKPTFLSNRRDAPQSGEAVKLTMRLHTGRYSFRNPIPCAHILQDHKGQKMQCCIPNQGGVQW